MYPRDSRSFHPQRRKTTSFSSSLLEAIYRSIDESEGQDECSALDGEGLGGSARKQNVREGFDRDSASAGRRGFTSLERVIMIEEWMEKQGSRGRCSSSTSDSSSGGRMNRSQNRMPTPDDGGREKTKKKKDRNEDFGSRTKLGALKMYGELKKAKQPISPGGKISAFLNSIFNSGNVKKAKMCYVGAADDVSSFDRKPCMSKTPSARKLSADDGTSNSKRSQRSSGDDIPEPFVYRTVLRTYPSYKEKAFASKTTKNWVGDDKDSDARSCSSSDLFELGDHLIGVEELPVYETTSFKRNQAIARGFIF